MITKMKIPEKYRSRMHFDDVEFEKLNILFGGNGSGKTTLLNCIRESIPKEPDDKDYMNDLFKKAARSDLDDTDKGTCDTAYIKKSTKKKYYVHSYVNSKNNALREEINPFLQSKDYVNKVSNRVWGGEISEGQCILFSFSKWLSITLENMDPKGYHIILLDEIDSGLSCDHVNVILHVINDDLLSKKNVQVFVSSNMYHWVYAAKRVLSLYNGRFITIDSYDRYFKIQQDNQYMVGKKSDFNFLG